MSNAATLWGMALIMMGAVFIAISVISWRDSAWKRRAMCRLGSHEWSCRGRWNCMGLGDHYCLHCLYGFAAWAGKDNTDVGDGNV